MTAEPVFPGPVPARPDAIRSALSGADRALFEAEFRAALEAAGHDFSLERLNAVLDRWRRFANLAGGHAAAVSVAEQILAGAEVSVVEVDLAALRGG